MRNPINLLPRLFQYLPRKSQFFSQRNWALFLLTVGLTLGWGVEIKAETPDTAPPQLKELLSQIDAAANQRNIEGVMQFYSADFQNSDGLTRAAMEQALEQLWERYPQLNYRTQLQSWERQGDDIVAETVTYIMGTQPQDGTMVKLEATMRSRQRYENQQVVSSEILAEQTLITSGANPPSVKINLPERVRIGQQFNFDAIVEEPLGDNLLLGTAMEEPIQASRYTQPTNFELELLSAGGLFKVGKAPLREEDRWISAVLIRGDGITRITRRLQVVDPASASTKAPE
ncbi:nuclear transport factor 2 family protein [Coleofasciculus sp. LEGE 07081]|uniref:nuclear transport factor 2 family protein n=1 Tax=unclassified Coleofasciculus TaxID=2692782 RepID=UPI00187FF6A9|nr:nuclear transport factor 2 family protein [Coleofasciculus sp. LEGE 07081]MBE9149727.1 nuclear transport factor 2 family protein [Coleofasciculus sp. LEGE 07092]